MKNFFAILFLILIGAGLYAATLRGSIGNALTIPELREQTAAGQAFESSHERSSFAMLLAMRNDHTVELTKELADFGSPDIGFIHNKFYSFFPPGIPVLIQPLYEYGLQYNIAVLASFATIAILAVFSLVLLFLIARQMLRLPIWSSLLAALIFGFATTSWSYAGTIYQHVPTAFALLLCVYSVWRFRVSPRMGWLWGVVAGAVYGLSVFIDYPNAILLAPAMVYLVVSAFSIVRNEEKVQLKFRLSVLLGIIVCGGVFASHLYYNKQVFGSPLQFHNPAPRYTTERYEELLESGRGNQETKPGNAVKIFNEYAITNGGYELSIATDKGLIIFSPILLFALLGAVLLFKRAPYELLLFLTLVLVNVLMYASFADPWGGWAFGPRYLIPAMASLSVLAAAGVALLPRYNLLGRAVAFILIAYSSAVALMGALTSNLVPPKIEADFLHIKFGLSRALEFFYQGTTGSFWFNAHASKGMTLVQYFSAIYILVLVIFFVVLFILPLFGNKTKSEEDKV